MNYTFKISENGVVIFLINNKNLKYNTFYMFILTSLRLKFKLLFSFTTQLDFSKLISFILIRRYLILLS